MPYKLARWGRFIIRLRGPLAPFNYNGGIYMDIKDIIKKVKNRRPGPMDVTHKYSVLIPIVQIDNRLEILYELRSKDMASQPGEISFPGGGVEEGESYEDAAIRETMEELNIKRENINLVGELDFFVSYSNLTIHCFLGIISGIDVDKIVASKDEVDHIFTVPLDFFIGNEPDVYYLNLRTDISEEFPYNLIPNGRDYKWREGKHKVMFYHYNDYIIWGFTAKMTKRFIDIIN